MYHGQTLTPATFLAESVQTGKYQAGTSCRTSRRGEVTRRVRLPGSHLELRTWRECHDRKPLPSQLISRALTRVTFAPRFDEKRFPSKSIVGRDETKRVIHQKGGRRWEESKMQRHLSNTCLRVSRARARAETDGLSGIFQDLFQMRIETCLRFSVQINGISMKERAAVQDVCAKLQKFVFERNTDAVFKSFSICST